METLDTEEPANAGADSETLQTEQTDENADGGTSEDGQQEDADAKTLKKQLSDKDRHIEKLETENRKLKKGVGTREVPDDEITDWKILHSDEIRIVGKEYQEEINFFKEQGVKITVPVLERALGNAKARKGLTKSSSDETKRQQETSAPTQGEHRAGKPKRQLTEQQKAMGITQEMLDKYGPEVEARRKK